MDKETKIEIYDLFLRYGRHNDLCNAVQVECNDPKCKHYNSRSFVHGSYLCVHRCPCSCGFDKAKERIKKLLGF